MRHSQALPKRGIQDPLTLLDFNFQSHGLEANGVSLFF